MKKFILTSTLLSLALFSCQSDNIIDEIKKQEENKKEEIKDKEEEKKEEEQKKETPSNPNTPPMSGIVPLKEIDLSFWSTFGKNDANESNIVDESTLTYRDIYKKNQKTREVTKIREVLIWNKINVDYLNKRGGRELVRGEAFVFTPMLHISGKPFHGEIKMSLWQNGKLVEQYPAKELKQEREFPYHGARYLCYIEAPVGEYELRVLIREHGSDKWVIPPYAREYNKKEHWLFTVKEKPDVPAVNKIETSLQTVEKNKPFTVKYELVNNGSTPLKGEVKFVWERLHDGAMHEKENLDRILSLYRGYFPDEDITRSWSDEIGKISVDIDPKSILVGENKNCVITTTRLFGNNTGPYLRLYFKAENSNEWVLMRGYSIGNLEANDIKVINQRSYDTGENYVYIETTDNDKQMSDYYNKQNKK